MMFVLFHQRVCGLLANSLLHCLPSELHHQNSKLLTKKQTPLSNASLIYLRLEVLRDESQGSDRSKNLELKS